MVNPAINFNFIYKERQNNKLGILPLWLFKKYRLNNSGYGRKCSPKGNAHSHK